MKDFFQMTVVAFIFFAILIPLIMFFDIQYQKDKIDNKIDISVWLASKKNEDFTKESILKLRKEINRGDEIFEAKILNLLQWYGLTARGD